MAFLSPVFQLRLGRLTLRSERGYIRDRLAIVGSTNHRAHRSPARPRHLAKHQLLMRIIFGGRDELYHSIDASLYLTWRAKIVKPHTRIHSTSAALSTGIHLPDTHRSDLRILNFFRITSLPLNLLTTTWSTQ